ncbi:hypothetical protein HW532_15640 [Kaustia mangrovi]|uniref:Uncharacterized protein n=1 Tax=Kaustia mangrovi TaxID=2593653 RepID=A0A7S8HCU6_9HYPH|nr:hypothetical protein [Kaustia mangrovi]QPC43996.1 hypothetical protein HW532_15640 [Kaustia mangrovi]
MFEIDAKWRDAQVKRLLWRLESRQWPFAIAMALTRIGKRVKSAERDEMKRVFDRPTPYTLNSLRLEPATKSDLQARIWFREFAGKGTPAAKYLLPQVYGGSRVEKRFERRIGLGYLMPTTAAPLDRYGNVRRSIYSKILSGVGAQGDPYQNSPRGSRKRKTYFRGTPRGHGVPGIWERQGRDRLRPIFIAIPSPSYSPRFAFFGVAERSVNEHWEVEFNTAIQRALGTSR